MMDLMRPSSIQGGKLVLKIFRKYMDGMKQSKTTKNIYMGALTSHIIPFLEEEYTYSEQAFMIDICAFGLESQVPVPSLLPWALDETLSPHVVKTGISAFKKMCMALINHNTRR